MIFDWYLMNEKLNFELPLYLKTIVHHDAYLTNHDTYLNEDIIYIKRHIFNQSLDCVRLCIYLTTNDVKFKKSI